ncbi:MAG: ROK family protein [Candidatus Dormibacteria bacterium]
MSQTQQLTIVGVDLGGTWVRAASFASDGTIAKRARVRTASTLGPQGVADQICAVVAEVAPGPAAGRLTAVGVPGPVDPVTGVVEGAPNLPGWRRVPLRQMVEAGLGGPCLVDHDASLAALGEHRQGAGRGFSNFAYITVSTGIGAGLVFGGRLYRGAQGTAGEFGHMVIAPDGPVCSCGNHGCLEALASGTAIARAAGMESAAAVSRAALAGDHAAAEVLNIAATHLGLAVGSLINLLNLDAIALGGGVLGAGPDFWTAMEQGVARSSFASARAHCRVVPAELGEDQGLFGAFELAAERRLSTVTGRSA